MPKKVFVYNRVSRQCVLTHPTGHTKVTHCLQTEKKNKKK